jgi:hypothetical protein
LLRLVAVNIIYVCARLAVLRSFVRPFLVMHGQNVPAHGNRGLVANSMVGPGHLSNGDETPAHPHNRWKGEGDADSFESASETGL